MLSALRYFESRLEAKSSLLIVAIRHQSSSRQGSDESKPYTINSNASFRAAYQSPLSPSKRPIVLIYSWLLAKSKHIFKYSDFYLDKGFDVINLKINPPQLLYPAKTQQVISETLDFMTDRPPQPILIHGFSVGAYVYGEMLVKIAQQPNRYGDIGNRIVAQVFDSPVDLEGIPRGVSKAVTHNLVIQKVLFTFLQSYLKLMKNVAVKHYVASQQAFYENKNKTPSLLLYSSADPVGTVEPIRNVVNMWRDKDINVDTKCWEDSGHVQHYLKHPIEYTQELNMFLQKMDLLNHLRKDTDSKEVEIDTAKSSYRAH